LRYPRRPCSRRANGRPQLTRSRAAPDEELALSSRSTAVSWTRSDQSAGERFGRSGTALAHRLHNERVSPPIPGGLERLENSMTRRPLAAFAAIIFVLSACASVDVRAVTSPDANLAALHTFKVMPNPKPLAPVAHSTNDPMLVNSISNRALRSDLVKGFEDRGYVLSDSKPDFSVAYYASTKEKLDVTYWDYGYSYYPHWWGGWGPGFGSYQPTTTQYTQGTVIVDVVDPSTKELLWRGQGVAPVSDNEAQYEQDLLKAVTAILAKFPQAHQGT
jgi:hypothetical protein